MAESKAEARTRLKSGGFLPAWDTESIYSSAIIGILRVVLSW